MSFNNPFKTIATGIERRARERRESELSGMTREKALAEVRASVWFDGTHAYTSPNEYAKRRDELAGTGVVTKEELDGLPEIRTAAERSILSNIGSVNQFSDVELFLRERDRWVGLGVVTAEEVNALPAVRKAAYRDLTAVSNYTVENSEQEKRKWREAGILKDEEMDGWIAAARKRLERLESS